MNKNNMFGQNNNEVYFIICSSTSCDRLSGKKRKDKEYGSI